MLAIVIASSITVLSALNSNTQLLTQNKEPKNEVPLEFMNWNLTKKPPLEFYDTLIQSIVKRYPNLAKAYVIGHSWRERKIWCIELTSNVKSKESKIPIAII